MKSHTTAGRDAFGSGLVSRFLLGLLLVIVFAAKPLRADRLIGGGIFNIADLDPANGADTFVIDLPEYDCWNTNLSVVDSIVEDPVSGDFFGILNGVSNVLITIDPATGEITVIGDIGLQEDMGRITSITFGSGPDHTLYAINEGSGEVDGTIWTLNPASGVPTETGWTVSGTGRNALEFNSDDGLLYHFYSDFGTESLETFDPSTGLATPVVISGDSYDSVSGIAYAGAGSNLFYAYDNINGKIFSITTGGGCHGVERSSGLCRGAGLCGLQPDRGRRGRSDVSITIPGPEADPTRYSWECFEKCPASISSIAQDSATGDYYVITEKDDPLGGDGESANSLAMIDIDTGLFSNQVNLSSWGVSGITVGPLGQLYGVLDGNAPLGRGTIVTIDKATGQVTDTGWATNQTADGHSLEYNPDDGLLYHFYTDGSDRDEEKIETIDPDTGDVVQVGALIGWITFRVVGAVYRGNGLFYLLDSANFIHTVTTGGDVTESSGGLPQVPYMALELGPDRVNIALERAKLQRQIRKVKRALKKARQRGQRSKVRSLSRKLRILKRKLRQL